MNKEELEQEAEDIANKRCREIMCFGHCSFSSPKHHRCGEWHREYNCAKEGIEYGYNKANEWHKVAHGDLPSEEGGWVCNQNGLPCFFDWGTEQWLDCEGTQVRTTEWCHMPHKE